MHIHIYTYTYIVIQNIYTSYKKELNNCESVKKSQMHASMYRAVESVDRVRTVMRYINLSSI